MKIDESEWSKLRAQLQESPFMSQAAVALCAKSLAELEKESGMLLEKERFDPSYMGFLDEQIALNARGPEWTALLKGRREAIGPYVGKEIGLATVSGKGQKIYLRFEPESLRVIWTESHEVT